MSATSVKAMASLALAVLSTCIWAFTDFSPISVAPIALACVILAVFALYDIRRSQGTLAGRSLAIGGICTGIGSTLIFLGLLPAVQKVREAALRMTLT